MSGSYENVQWRWSLKSQSDLSNVVKGTGAINKAVSKIKDLFPAEEVDVFDSHACRLLEEAGDLFMCELMLILLPVAMYAAVETVRLAPVGQGEHDGTWYEIGFDEFVQQRLKEIGKRLARQGMLARACSSDYASV